MTISDEKLMAYVDGELDGETRAEVESAAAADAELARRIERQRSLRQRLHAAYDPILEAPLPARLLAAVRGAPAGPPAAKVIPLRRTQTSPAPRWSMREWTAIAASLIVGALVSALALHTLESGPVSSRGGQLIARGALARALSTELASRQPPDAPVAIGVTFLSHSGDYCRTFSMRGPSGLAGLACHDQGAWKLVALARSESAASTAGSYRPAASSIPQSVLDAASAAIAGDALDARAEAAAQASGWVRR